MSHHYSWAASLIQLLILVAIVGGIIIGAKALRWVVRWFCVPRRNDEQSVPLWNFKSWRLGKCSTALELRQADRVTSRSITATRRRTARTPAWPLSAWKQTSTRALWR